MLLQLAQLLWTLSWPAYLGFSLIFYMNFSTYLRMFGQNVPRESVVIGFFAVFLIANVAFMALANLPKYLPLKLLLVPNRSEWVSTEKNFQALCKMLKQWVYGLGLTVNLTLISCLFVLYYDIDQQSETPLTYLWAIYVCFALSLGWLGYYVPLFAKVPED